MDEACFCLRLPSMKKAPSSTQLAVISPASQRAATGVNAADAKVMYAEMSLAILTRNTHTRKFTMVRAELACPLMQMRRNTAENTLRCHREVFDNIPGICSDEFQDNYKAAIGAACMDAHSGNKKCVNELRIDDSERPKKRRRLAFNCDVHPSASVLTRTWKLTDTHITGLLRLAIEQRGAGRFEEFQKTLGDECVSILEIRRSLLYLFRF